MGGFVVTIRRAFKKDPEIYCQAPSENSAISKADKIYNQLLLDSVVVIEVDSKNGFINASYKRERRCKHPNVQFNLTLSGVQPICDGCGMVMVTQEEEMIENERHS